MSNLLPRIGARMAWVVALIVPALGAACMIPARGHSQTSNLALIMVLIVAVSVVPGYRLAGAAAGVAAGIWFDFLLTRPYGQLSIQRSADVQTTVLLCAVAVVVGEISARRRKARMEGDVAKNEVVGLYVVAQMLSAGARSQAVIDVVGDQLRELLFLEDCRFETWPATERPFHINRAGEIFAGANPWAARRQGLPLRDVALPVDADGQTVGQYVLRGPVIGVPVSNDRLLVGVALADLAGAAVLAEKSIFLG